MSAWPSCQLAGFNLAYISRIVSVALSNLLVDVRYASLILIDVRLICTLLACALNPNA